MPNEPQETNFKYAKVRLKAYPTAEVGGERSGPTWALRKRFRRCPNLNGRKMPENYRHLSKMWQECNWLQALEGVIDNAHAGFLHRALTDKTARAGLRVLGELPGAATRCPSHRLRIHVHGNPSFARAGELRARVPVRDALSPVFPVADRPQR